MKIFHSILCSLLFSIYAAQQCGKVLEELRSSITHPEYPAVYGPNTDCRWTTIAREKDDVQIAFELLDLEVDGQGGCSYDYVSILFISKEEGPERFCGRTATRDPNAIPYTEGKGGPIVRFITDNDTQYGGFKIHYRIDRYDYCEDEPCQNEGECITDDSVPEGFTCDCLEGWEGLVCDEDKDECASEPCQNGATCLTPEFNMYECECSDGYTGENCEIDIDECESQPCQNDGECIDEVNSYLCECLDGYRGTNCEEDVDECESNPCQNGGACEDGVDGYTCQCEPGWEGSECQTDTDECASGPCQNGGECVDGLNEYECDCEDGFVGNHCELDIPECSSEPCLNEARCFEPKPGEYFCACPPGYTGTMCETDEDECRSDPCVHSVECVDRPNSFTCECTPGYTGELCESEIDECSSDPCLNGGTCHDKLDEFECGCTEGYQGLFCENEINHCSSNPCLNGGTCNSTLTEYSCQCQDGFEGKRCQIDLDECESNPCVNGGTCTEGRNRFDCQCTDGYGGVMCEIELDECDSVPCVNDGKCVDYPSRFECFCMEGYEGKTCEVNTLSPCFSAPCANGGTCTEDDQDGYTCICPTEHPGEHCEEDDPGDEEPKDEDESQWKDEEKCHPYSCLNNGVCEQQEGYFTCECKDGFSGRYCDTDVDECASDPCQNGGSCLDRENEYWCVCADGFRGLHCEDDWKSGPGMLAAVLPSILFLIIIAVLAVLFMLWVRKKRAEGDKVSNIDVKPKNESVECPDVEKLQTPYDPIFPPPINPLAATAPDHSQIQYSTVPGVGMVYPTNQPHFSLPRNHYPSFQRNRFSDLERGSLPQERPEHNYNNDNDHYRKSTFYDHPKGLNNTRMNMSRTKREDDGEYQHPYKNSAKQAKEAQKSRYDTSRDANDFLSDSELDDNPPEYQNNNRRAKEHWQDRDNVTLNNLPKKHHGYPGDNDFDNSEHLNERRPSKKERQVHRKRTVTFREPESFTSRNRVSDKNREDKEARPRNRVREETQYFPSKTTLHRKNADGDKGRTSIPNKQRGPNRRRYGAAPDNPITPIAAREEGSDRRQNRKDRDIEGKKQRHSPEGDSSIIPGEPQNPPPPIGYSTAFKSIRRKADQSLRAKGGRGLQREGAFFHD